MGAAVLESLAALHSAVQLVKEARSIWKGMKVAKGGAPEELERKLEQAEHQLELAKAGAARDLGYPLCRCTFPPQVMTVIRVDNDGMEYWGCHKCGREQGPPQVDRGDDRASWAYP